MCKNLVKSSKFFHELLKIWCALKNYGRTKDFIILYKDNLDWYVKSVDDFSQLTTYNRIDDVSVKVLQRFLNDSGVH